MENNNKGILQFLHPSQAKTRAEAFGCKLNDFFAELKSSAGNEILRLQIVKFLGVIHSIFPEESHKDLAVSLEHLNANVYCASFAWIEPGDENSSMMEFCMMNLVLNNRTLAWIDLPRIQHIAAMKPLDQAVLPLNCFGMYFSTIDDNSPTSIDHRITAILETRSSKH